MRVNSPDHFKVWKIVDDGKKATIDMSCSRKVDEKNYGDKEKIEHNIAKNGYISESFKFTTFVGKAYNKLKKYEVKEGDTITNLEMREDYEGFYNVNSQAVEYPKYPRRTVFDFELPGSTKEEGKPAQTPRNIDRAPIVESEEEYTEENPF